MALLPRGGSSQHAASGLLPRGGVEQLASGGGGTAAGVTLTATASLLAGSASGTGSGSATGVTLTATSSLVAGSASGTSAATLTSEVLHDKTGTVSASSALDWVRVYDTSVGDRVLTKTGLSTNGGGVFTFSDAALTTGVEYELRWKESNGKQGFGFKTAT